MNKQGCISPDAGLVLAQVFNNPAKLAHAFGTRGFYTEPTGFLCVKEDAPDDVVVSVPAPPPPPPKVPSNISIQKRCIIGGVDIKPKCGSCRVTYTLV